MYLSFKISFMYQSIETPAPRPPPPTPRPPGHSGEFNIYPVLKDGLFPGPGAKRPVKSPA